MKKRTLKPAYQRVSIDVDMASRALRGTTEITILPLTNQLRSIRLDAREMRITGVYINSTRHTNYVHRDMLYINDDAYFDSCVEKQVVNVLDLYAHDVGIHQHHLIRQKLNYVFGESNADPREPPPDVHSGTGELVILLPEKMRLELTSINNLTPGSTTPHHKKSQSEVYTPIHVKVEYEVVNPRNGITFVTEGERRSWHAYTTNGTHNISTSSWVPCLDNLWDRCTWSVEVNVPRTVRDIKKEHEEVEDDEDDDINDDLVVCGGDFNNVKETPHPTDLSKKVVSWSIFNPVCAHHVGWALGCFESFVLVDEVDEEKEMYEEEKDVKQPVTVYCMAEHVELARNTVSFCNHALDHFAREYGSFPFSSYAMVFVGGSTVDSNSFAGLSVVHDELLYPADLIEPIFHVTDVVLESIAAQWCGINISPQTFNDMWCTIGIARYMALQYTRSLVGENEYRFRVRKAIGQICEEDHGRKPLAMQFLRFPVNERDLDFVRLKAPIVLHILDKRMTKTDKSFGLSRVIPKLFLQAMSGDLPNGTLSTAHLQYVCEKVNRNKLEPFFKQWVYGVGTPVFYITQRFNKKRGLIEMSIRQTQAQHKRKTQPQAERFLDDAIALLDDEPQFGVQPVFTGPMTIRVHELDGTPYEHIVELKEAHTKVDIQYNAKFKRMKKLKEDMDESIATFHRLGDVLKSPEEVADWGLQDFERPEDEVLFADAFEWIRVDVDYEWIGQFEVKQQDYMYASQLIYDRDVEAQYHAVRHFGDTEKPTREHCTVLTRTLADPQYYYGVRIAAAEALARFSRQSNGFMGVGYIVRVFKEQYCFAGSTVPKSNDFSDIGRFLLQRAIPRILSGVCDDAGATPSAVRSLLFNLVKFNDNANNAFQDCFYVAELISALSRSVCNGHSIQDKSTDTSDFDSRAAAEIDRLHKLDTWVPSYHHIVAVTCIREKAAMARHGLVPLSLETWLYYTLDKYPEPVRVAAFHAVLLLGGLRNRSVLRYFLKTCLLEANTHFRHALMDALVQAVCAVATDGAAAALDDPEFFVQKDSKLTSNMVIIEDASAEMDHKRDALARATISGAIDVLRRDYAVGRGLREVLWELLHTSLLSIYEKRNVFTIVQVLYKHVDSFIVRIPLPSVPVSELKRKIVLRDMGDGIVVLRREGRFKIQLPRKEKRRRSGRAEERKRDQRKEEKEHEVQQKQEIEVQQQREIEVQQQQEIQQQEIQEEQQEQQEIKVEPTFDMSLVSVVNTTITVKSNRLGEITENVPEVVQVDEVPESSPLVSYNGTLVSIRLPKRYIKINTRKRRVTASPFPAPAKASAKAPAKASSAKASSVSPKKAPQDNGTKKAASVPPKKPASSPEKARPKVRVKLEDEEERRKSPFDPAARAVSPFDSAPVKRKKTKIYIHNKPTDESDKSIDKDKPDKGSTDSSVEPRDSELIDSVPKADSTDKNEPNEVQPKQEPADPEPKPAPKKIGLKLKLKPRK